MIELDPLAITPPDATIQTDPLEKPSPDSDPLPILEPSRFLDTSNVGQGEIDRMVLFSGGDDSLALTHYIMETLNAGQAVVYLATNSGIPENLDFVRSVADQFNWPLLILGAPISLETFAARWGFPGPDQHTVAYNWMKGRQLNYMFRRREGTLKLFSGVRQQESARRLQHIDGRVDRAERSAGDNFTGYWLNEVHDWSDDEIEAYRRDHDLPRNPIAEKLNRSGDCSCLAFGHRISELTNIEAHYPDFAEWLLNVERRVQEYRGRVEILAQEYPDIKTELDGRRKNSRPHPFRLTILKEAYPDVYETITAVPAEKAILAGRTDPTNYIGHGGLSSNELRSLTAAADGDQQTLCDSCSDPCQSTVPVVEELTSDAQQQVASAAEPLQTELPVEVSQPALGDRQRDRHHNSKSDDRSPGTQMGLCETAPANDT